MPDNALLPARPQTRLLRRLLLAAALLLGGPVSAETVRVGVYANEPKLLLNADGHLSGIFGELLEQIAEAEGWTLQAVPCEWQQCLEQTRDGTIDLMPDVAWSEERAARATCAWPRCWTCMVDASPYLRARCNRST